MFGRRAIAVAATALAVTFAGATAALGAGGTPQDICNDLRAHGHLTHHYTQAQIAAYQSDTTIQGYCPHIVAQQASTAKPLGGSHHVFSAPATNGSGPTSGMLPFTGFRLAVASIVAAGLILGGALMWFASRRRRT